MYMSLRVLSELEPFRDHRVLTYRPTKILKGHVFGNELSRTRLDLRPLSLGKSDNELIQLPRHLYLPLIPAPSGPSRTRGERQTACPRWRLDAVERLFALPAVTKIAAKPTMTLSQPSTPTFSPKKGLEKRHDKEGTCKQNSGCFSNR
jgi:hypothetical protein